MKNLTLFILVIALLTIIGCGEKKSTIPGLSGDVKIDGSSTVFPISEAVAEEFGKAHPRVRVTVGVSGTGGGFKKYTIGELDINDASRPIKGKEIKKAIENNVEFIELPVAFDGLSVVVSKENTWINNLTKEELHMIWKPDSRITRWSDIRPNWPQEKIKLYGPGTDSGTFDYFTEAINGKSQVCRSDFSKSEDDNVLVQGIAGDKHSLGFFGFAYYKENKDKLKIVPIDGGNGPIAPSEESINNGTYQPLSRPIFIYVNPVSGERPEVSAFVEFYMKEAKHLVGEVGYVALPDQVYTMGLDRFNKKITGSTFSGKNTVGVKIENLWSSNLR